MLLGVRRSLLARVGRAEPDDLQGWLEHGGALALQRALALPPSALRAAAQESGVMLPPLRVGQPVHIALDLGSADEHMRLLVEELPAHILEGALLLALVCEQPHARLYLSGGALSHLRLLCDVVATMERLGFLGPGGWAHGVRLDCTRGPAPASAFSGEVVALLPVALWHPPRWWAGLSTGGVASPL